MTETIFSTWVTVHLTVASIVPPSSDSNGQNSSEKPSSTWPVCGWKPGHASERSVTSRM